MSYDPTDAAMDEMYERIGNEPYREHREQALSEFAAERLLSFYLANAMVMRPAVGAFQEMRKLKANGHPAAALVFASSTIELFLKATVLQPVVYGLAHTPALADIISCGRMAMPSRLRYAGSIPHLVFRLITLSATRFVIGNPLSEGSAAALHFIELLDFRTEPCREGGRLKHANVLGF